MDERPCSPAIINQVKDLVQTAGSVHRLLHNQTKKHLTEPFLPELHAVTGLVLRVTGVIHSLLLHLQVLSDGTLQQNSSNNELSCLTLCADLLSGIEDQLQDDGALKETDFPGANKLTRFHDDLLAVLTRLNIALHSRTWEVAVGTLSGTLPSAAIPAEQQDHRLLVISNRAPPEAQSLIRSNWTYHHSNTKLQWLLDQRCKETGEWLFEIDVVKQWLKGTYHFAFIFGSSGCGKTFLSAAVLEQLSKRVATHSTLCYHFADPHEANELGDILQPLVLQILTQHPKAWQAYLKFLLSRGILLDQELSPQVSCLKDVKLLVPLFKTLLSLSNKIYIILDGLDGISPGIACELFGIFLGYNSIRVLVLSRPLADRTWARICHQLQDKAAEYAACEIGSNHGDIQAYIRENAAQTTNGASKPPITLEQLESYVLGPSMNTSNSLVQPSFQLSKCRLWYIQTRHRFREPPAALDRPNSSEYSNLHGFYKAVVDATKYQDVNLQRPAQSVIDFSFSKPGNQNILSTALEWLLAITKQGSETPNMACSKRAFFEGLSVALLPDAKSLDGPKPSSRELESECSWLFDLFAHEIPVQAPTDQHRDIHGGILKPYRYCLYNRSFLEYAQENICHLDVAKGRISLAAACLRFLNMTDYSIRRDERQTAAIGSKNPFYDFAAAWWPYIGSETLDQTRPLALELFKEQRNFQNWLDAYLRTHFLHDGHGKSQASPCHDLTSNQVISRDHAHTAFKTAVSLGLSPLLEPLYTHFEQCKQLFPRLYTHKQESNLNLLQLVLFGPQVLVTPTAHTQARFSSTVSAAACPLSIDTRGTISYILDRNMQREEHVHIPFLAAHALLVCAKLQNSRLFIKIAERFPGRTYERHMIFTQSFADTLERLDPGRFSEFQNDVCQYILDFDGAFHAKHPSYDEFSDDSDLCGDDEDDEDDTDQEDDETEKDCRVVDRCTPKYLVQLVWQISKRNELDCARMDGSRRLDCEDWEYFAFWVRTHYELRVDWINRLLQDPRRAVKRPLDDPIRGGTSLYKDTALQTPLHLLAEVKQPSQDILEWIKALINFGADVNARDGRGRTPLHLVESTEALEMLCHYGADLEARDEDGRNVWHVAAFNHDVPILKALRELDLHPLESLRATTTSGRTPLAEAIGNLQTSTSAFGPCVEILSLCSHDSLCFASDVPITHMAARCANEPLLQELDKAGAMCPGAITKDGETAYHFLGVFVTPRFVRTLKQIYGDDNELLVRLDNRGLTAVERWIMSSIDKTRMQEYTGDLISLPSKQTCICVFKFLLAPIVAQSKNTAGVTLWERLCYTWLPELFRLSRTKELRDFPSAHADYINAILEAITKSVVTEFYEEQTSNCALIPLVSSMGQLENIFGEPHSMAELIFYRFMQLLLEKTQHVEGLRKSPLVANLLCTVALRGPGTLAMALLAHGVSADTFGLKGYSFLDKMGELQMPEFLEFLNILAHPKEGETNATRSILDRLLHSVIRKGYPDGKVVDKVKAVLEAGADVNAVDEDGMSPLHYAALGGSLAVAQRLLESGCDPSRTDSSGRTPLMLALSNVVRFGSKLPRMIRNATIQSRSEGSTESFPLATDMDVGGQDGVPLSSALEKALEDRNLAAVRELLEFGCSSDTQRPDCTCTALMHAIKSDFPEAAELLLLSEAKDLHSRCSKHFGKQDMGGFDILKQIGIRVRRRGCSFEPCLRLVLDIALGQQLNWFLVEAKSTGGVIHNIVGSGGPRGLEVILEHIQQHAGAYSNWLPETFTASEHTARKLNDLETAGKVISHLLHERSSKGETALHLAVRNSLPVEALLTSHILVQHGSNVNTADWLQKTPLHVAIHRRHILCIRLLLDHGADVNRRIFNGLTPLMLAAFEREVYICRMLIEMGGADMSLRTSMGESLLSCCCQTDGRSGSTKPPLKLFAYLTQLSVSQAARGKGHVLDAHDRNLAGYTPLHHALKFPEMTAFVFNGPYDFAQLATSPEPLGDGYSFISKIISHGNGRLMLPRIFKRWPRVDWLRAVNTNSSSLCTPLCQSVANGNHWEVRWLLLHGAQPEIEGSYYGTPLMVACSLGRLDMVQLLIREGGACVSYTTKMQSGACDVRNALACAAAYPEVVRWLLVGRYTEQPKITTPGPAQPRSISYWSGPSRVKVELPSIWEHSCLIDHPRIDPRTIFGLAFSLARAGDMLKGRVVPDPLVYDNPQ